jgi:hypothetical protein
MGEPLRIYYYAGSGFAVVAGEQKRLYQSNKADENKRKFNNMTNKTTPYIDHAGTMIIPFNADKNITTGMVVSPCQIPY